MLTLAWSEEYELALPEGHRFPMSKYGLIPEQLKYEGTITESQIFDPAPVKEEILLLTHCANYIRRFRTGNLTSSEIRRSGFPWSPELVSREYKITQGSIDAMLRAQQFGVGFNVAGGTHHAFRDAAEGFCFFNDLAVAANYWLSQYPNSRILIVDLDVHQGNGTASIFRNEKRVFTFSMHGKNNFPHRKEQSTLDLALDDQTRDEEFLQLLDQHLPRIIDDFKPDQLLYLSGVDVLATDKLGKLALTRNGCLARDRYVFECAIRHQLPVTVSMGGGYSTKLSDIVEAHCNTYRIANDLFF